jgi:hypothetical protein
MGANDLPTEIGETHPGLTLAADQLAVADLRHHLRDIRDPVVHDVSFL